MTTNGEGTCFLYLCGHPVAYRCFNCLTGYCSGCAHTLTRCASCLYRGGAGLSWYTAVWPAQDHPQCKSVPWSMGAGVEFTLVTSGGTTSNTTAYQPCVICGKTGSASSGYAHGTTTNVYLCHRHIRLYKLRSKLESGASSGDFYPGQLTNGKTYIDALYGRPGKSADKSDEKGEKTA